jgi:hypothetical protein
MTYVGNVSLFSPIIHQITFWSSMKNQVLYLLVFIIILNVISVKVIADEFVCAKRRVFAAETNVRMFPIVSRIYDVSFLQQKVQHQEKSIRDDHASNDIFITDLHFEA